MLWTRAPYTPNTISGITFYLNWFNNQQLSQSEFILKGTNQVCPEYMSFTYTSDIMIGLVWFGLLGVNASATARVISRRWNDDDDEISYYDVTDSYSCFHWLLHNHKMASVLTCNLIADNVVLNLTAEHHKDIFGDYNAGVRWNG